MKVLNLVVSCLVTVLLTSCNYSERKGMETVVTETEQEKLSSDFASVKQNVFDLRCVSCHQQYSEYQGVAREISAIQAAVKSDRMPKIGGPLTDSQKAILFRWIAKGAPEKPGIPSDPNPPMKLEPTWKSLSENVFTPKCVVCHNPQGQAKFLDLSSRQAVLQNRDRVFGDGSKFIDQAVPEKSYLVQILKDDEEPMPPKWSNIPRVTPDELKNIIEWLSHGLQ